MVSPLPLDNPGTTRYLSGMKTRFAAVAILALGLTACGGGKSHGAPGSKDITLPVWSVPAGQEILKCVYLSPHNTTDLYVNKFANHPTKHIIHGDRDRGPSRNEKCTVCRVRKWVGKIL